MSDEIERLAERTWRSVEAGYRVLLSEASRNLARAEAAEAENARLREALEEASATFLHYARIHEAKRNTEKADANRKKHLMCRAVLTPTESREAGNE